MTSGKRGSNLPQQFVCEYCGKHFERIVCPSSKGQFRFCSPTCRNKARSRPLVPCPICGTLFKDYVNDISGARKQYCSQECAWEAQKGRPSPKRTPQYILDAIKERYPTEGADKLAEEFDRTRCAIRVQAHKLGVKLNPDVYYARVHKAAQKYMTESNPMFNPETVEKVKEYWGTHPREQEAQYRKLQEAHARIQRENPSGLERKLWDILDSLDVDYETQFIVKPKFIVDVKIDNLIIQADGDYWHGHPRMEPLTKRQKTQQKRDRAQDKYLTTCGYAVERIWESDMSYDVVRDVLARNDVL